MSITESIRLALEALKSNKLRSFLTMLGIIIGISAVITITTIGSSLQATLSKTLSELGNTNIVYCYIDQNYPEMTEAEWETYEFPEKTENEKITYEKLMQFKEDFGGRVDSIELETSLGSSTVTTDVGSAKVSTTGVTGNYVTNLKLNMLSGRDITDLDNDEMKSTAVVSDLFVKYALDNENPLGKKIEIESSDGTILSFFIVGVYEYDRTTQSSMMSTTSSNVREQDIETPIYVPYTYVDDYLRSTDFYYDDMYYFYFYAAEGEDPTQLGYEAEDYFGEKYFNETGNYYVSSMSLESQLSQINTALNILTVAISVIAAISLVVGGVGVMNIMLVSVVERTREIGIRKALGAKNKSIRRQFLTEAVVICLLGGFIGIVIGILNGFVLAFGVGTLAGSTIVTGIDSLSISVSPSTTAIIVSVVFSTAIGLIFGYYPAKRAANMSPIDALRYE